MTGPLRMNGPGDDGGFRPAWWCRGPHLQTAWRRLFGPTPEVAVRRERWNTPDDDFLDLDFRDPAPPHSDDPNAPGVLLFHGLEGSSRSQYILGMLEAFRPLGWRGIALNFRSCSGEMNRRKRFYHSGETADPDWVIRELIRRYPGSPLSVVGFSLGGNALLKWLGEQGEAVPTGVRCAAAISVPFDLSVAANAIDHGVSRIYGQVFLRTLKQKAIRKAAEHPGLIDPRRVAPIHSFAEFDDVVTAPIHGFRDGRDYWTRSSSKNFLGGIRIPTLLLSAGDDPFLPEANLPVREVSASKWLTAAFTATGGHVGFVQGNTPGSATYWHESRTVEFLKRHLEDGGSESGRS